MPRDRVKIRMQPPVQGAVLYELIKEAAAESGYDVTEQTVSGQYCSLDQMEYVVDATTDVVDKRALPLFTLNLVHREGAHTGRLSVSETPLSSLSITVDLDKTYAAFSCQYSPDDSIANVGPHSITQDKLTHLDNFVIALHKAYQARQPNTSQYSLLLVYYLLLV